ncbi:MAG: DUF4198 domain-containing protein [Planctomycetota bacterium]
MKFSVLLSLAAGGLFAAPATAHDFWLEPQLYRVNPGAVVTVQAAIGHPGDAERFAHNPKHFERFMVVGERPAAAAPASADLVGLAGRLPTGRARLDSGVEGYVQAAYLSKGSTLTMDAAKFEGYLLGEGLEWVIEERVTRGESAADGTERYIRCAKALIQVGTSTDGWDRALGLPAELTPLTPPHAPRPNPDGSWGFDVRFDSRGVPTEGLLVEARSILDPEASVAARTDVEGRATFDLPRGGAWYFAAVEMQRQGDDAAHDWLSHWANLAVELPDLQ